MHLNPAKIFGRGDSVYDPRTAFFFGVVLSALMWWTPVIGPAVAGYVCGRKSGSMVKGTICAFAGGFVVLAAVWGLSAVFSHGYLDAFYSNDVLDLSSLGVMTVFGFAGGILSRQARKETADLLATGAWEGSIRPAARSMELYSKNKRLGFESFDDRMAIQDMAVNRSPVSWSGRQPQGSCGLERTRADQTAFRTVTNTVEGVTLTQSETPAQPNGRPGPFVDILGKAPLERRP
ncbi:MAG: hypothetical protein LBS92_07040 [Candidatus Methanoplasma sp.]|jgi:hypothetical protein|nr:hypothetical protein [Candidatus Methanoplasma sp.]